MMMEVNGWIYLFPISGSMPQPQFEGQGRLFEIVPEMERRRIAIGPDAQKLSHLILDHYNRVRPDRLYDFDSLTPMGSFSTRFLERSP